MEAPANGDGAGLAAYEAIKALLDKGQQNEAATRLEELLVRNPDDPDALYFLARLFIDTDKSAFARPIAESLALKYPGQAMGWQILGMVDSALQNVDRAIRSLEKAQSIRPSNLTRRVLALAYIMAYRFDDAKRIADELLSVEDHHLAHTALAFYHLHKRNWQEGWKHYRHQLGRSKDRNLLNYGLPEWEGNGSALIYAEQGLGDQLAYSSAIDERCTQLVCHPKLGNLLKRSLDCEVYPDQFKQQVDWQPKAQHQSSMASAMQFQEVKRRGRWLKPHPEKAVQWKALMYTSSAIKDRPWIGLAWTGGKVGSHGWLGRNITPQDLKPILDLPANFVSLEYREHEPVEGIHCWPWATQTADLDDFAALVDGLQAVVCVPTTTYHVCGGLGIPCHVIVHDRPHFHEGTEDTESPWWESVYFHRRHQGLEQAVDEVRQALERYL